MKRISILLFFTFVIGCFQSGGLRESQKLNQSMFTFPGISKNKLYELSLQYLAYSFKSAKAVLEYQNKDEGRIMGNIAAEHGCQLLTSYKSYMINYIITIDIKEGRTRFTLEPRSMSHARAGTRPLTNNYFCPGDLPIEDDFKMINSGYEEFIKKPIIKKSENW